MHLMMHCGRRFKYHDLSHLVVSHLVEFGVTVKVSALPPSLVAVDAVSCI